MELLIFGGLALFGGFGASYTMHQEELQRAKEKKIQTERTMQRLKEQQELIQKQKKEMEQKYQAQIKNQTRLNKEKEQEIEKMTQINNKLVEQNSSLKTRLNKLKQENKLLATNIGYYKKEIQQRIEEMRMKKRYSDQQSISFEKYQQKMLALTNQGYDIQSKIMQKTIENAQLQKKIDYHERKIQEIVNKRVEEELEKRNTIGGKKSTEKPIGNSKNKRIDMNSVFWAQSTSTSSSNHLQREHRTAEEQEILDYYRKKLNRGQFTQQSIFMKNYFYLIQIFILSLILNKAMVFDEIFYLKKRVFIHYLCLCMKDVY